MNKLNLNREWGFIVQGVNASNKGGTRRGRMFFELQILLTAISRIKSQKEKRMLVSIFEEYKRRYVGAGA